MSCGACVQHVGKALAGLVGVTHVDIDLERSEVRVAHLPQWVGDAGVIEAIASAGYVAAVAARTTGQVRPAAAARFTSCCCG